MRRNWRYIVPALIAVLTIDLLAGVVAYGSKTWNWNHTEVLSGWAAVREVCLVFIPITLAVLVVGWGVPALPIRWARKDRT